MDVEEILCIREPRTVVLCDQYDEDCQHCERAEARLTEGDMTASLDVFLTCSTTGPLFII